MQVEIAINIELLKTFHFRFFYTLNIIIDIFYIQMELFVFIHTSFCYY